MPTRIEIASQELTRDPIFLLQSRMIVPVNIDMYEWDSDTETIKNTDGEVITEEEMLEIGDAIEVWQTESVWLARSEAEEYAKRSSYEYPEGWRVYCVPADGALATLLAQIDLMRQASNDYEQS